MPLYTFFPYTKLRAALTFDARELDTDVAASVHARLMLSDHQNAERVEVWVDDELLVTELRSAPVA